MRQNSRPQSAEKHVQEICPELSDAATGAALARVSRAALVDSIAIASI